MINSKDYKTAYGLLAEGFKENKFKTEDAFKQYVKENLYSYNKVNLVKFSDEISGVYTYYIEVYNKEDEKAPKIKMNIIMQLLDGTKYKISFRVPEKSQVDASHIARQFGGNGHEKAAGCIMTLEEFDNL
jgi:nanoRNase/pAp phosphatase (c-di-AMP/oligoRNAs hydrolase)